MVASEAHRYCDSTKSAAQMEWPLTGESAKSMTAIEENSDWPVLAYSVEKVPDQEF